MKKANIFKVLAVAAALLTGAYAAEAQSFEERKSEFSLVRTSLVDSDLCDNILLGFSVLPPSSTGFSMDMVKSFAFAFDIISAEVRLNHEGTFFFRGSLRWSFENYVSREGYVFSSVNNKVVATPFVGSNLKKSKMRADYLGIPIGIVYDKNNFRAYVNVVGDYNTKAITKFITDSTTEKNELKGLNNLRASIEVGASYNDVGVYFKYGLTPTFVGRDEKICQVGITLGF